MNRSERRRAEKLARRVGPGGPGVNRERAAERALIAASEYLEAARPLKARAVLRAALKSLPGHPEILHLLGLCERELGNPEGTATLIQQAVAKRPDDPVFQFNLGEALTDLEDFEGAVDSYRRSLAAVPDRGETHLSLGSALFHLRRFDDALVHYRKAAALANDPKAHLNLGNTLSEIGLHDEAADAYRQAIALDGGYEEARVNLAINRLVVGAPDEALAICDELLVLYPASTSALTYRAVALQHLARGPEAARLVDHDRLIRTKSFKPPRGHSSMAAFNNALTRHILAHPTLRDAPVAHATREGRHSSELLSEPKGPFRAFEAMINEAVQDYMAAVPEDPGHPFLSRRPQRTRLTVWAVILEGCGYQVPHIHPSAWLSGVYYVKTPRVVDDPEADHAGWLEFGRPDSAIPEPPGHSVRLIRPVEGEMHLFPSYFLHRTVPFRSDDTRISIAFDVMAED